MADRLGISPGTGCLLGLAGSRQEGTMIYKVQVFHAESGFFLNTNHESGDLEQLKGLVSSEIFDGFRYRIVDEAGDEVPLDYLPRERKAAPTIDDIARLLKVPVTKRFEDLHLPGWTDQEDISS
jgi:hypothetical protein